MKLFLLASIFLFLASCAVTAETYPEQLQRMETIQVEESVEPGYDYKIRIENRIDRSWDFGREADRNKIIAQFLKDKCQFTQTISSDQEKIGMYLFGKKRILFTHKVKCIK